jgi:hypothetical protein
MAQHIPNRTPIHITGHAYVAAGKLGLTGEGFLEALQRARRVNRYKDGLRLWYLLSHFGGPGWAAVREVEKLDGSGDLLQADVIDVFTVAEQEARASLWQPRLDTPTQRARPVSQPRARAS